MKKWQRKSINRIINKSYSITKSAKLRVVLLNVATKVFKNRKNEIEFDEENQMFWLKHGNNYLNATKTPYFDFSKKETYQACLSIFCKHCDLQTNDTIVDIGAGIGTEICFFIESIGNKGNLYNIEASPSSFRILSLLTEKNNIHNCHNFNLAITNTNDPIWMDEGNNYVVNSINKNAQGVLIKASTLDQFVTENQIKSIKLLKVNIEGAEFDMIDGMAASVQIIDNIAISCHDFLFNEEPVIREKVVSFLTANKFQIVYANTGDKILDSWIYAKKSKLNLLY